MVDTKHRPGSPSPENSGWSSLFWEAFRRSRNPMVLLDDERRHVEVNGAYLQLLGYGRGELIGRPVYELVADGPLMSQEQWKEVMHKKQFTGSAELNCNDGRRVKVEFAGHPEVVTGRQLVLFVALRTARGIRRLYAQEEHKGAMNALSSRELEVIELIARGYSGPEIGQELHVAHNTVRTHVRNAMGKVGASSRAHLVAKALSEGVWW